MPNSHSNCSRRLDSWLLILTLGLCFLSTQLSAQAHNFHHYGDGAGLPQIQVFSVTQDQDGYLWVATYGGLGRYNGQSFRTFTTEDGLGANAVEALAVDQAGQIWAGTGSGLCLYADERFECDFHPILDEAYIYDLAVDGSALWVASEAGLFHLEEGRLVNYFRVTHGLPTNEVRSVSVAPDGAVWAGTAEGLVRRASSGFQSVALGDDSVGKVTALRAEDAQTWIGTDTGLFHYQGGQVRRVEALPDVAREADINSFARDLHGDLWVASSVGMLHGGNNGFRLLNQAHGLPTAISHSVYSDREGLIWIGHDNGLSKWVPRPFYGYLPEHGLLGPFVRTINEDEQGRLWLGTRLGLQVVPYQEGEWRIDQSWTITADDGLADERIYSIGFPRPGEALIATDNGVARWREGEGVVNIYTVDDGLPSNRTQAVWIDHHGNTWIGSNLGTVVMGDGEISPAPHPELAQAYTFRIQEDGSGRLWFGTRDHGLFLMEGGRCVSTAPRMV